MAIFRSLVTVTLLLVSLDPAHQARAQQAMPTVDQAKKEGEVVWYGTLTGGAIVGNIIKNFESKFPGIKVKYLRLGGASFVERIRSEARAGKYLWDVVTLEYIQFSELSKHVALARYCVTGRRADLAKTSRSQWRMGQHLWRHRDHRLEYPDG